MKKSVITLSFLFCLSLYGTVLTVDNRIPSIGQYATIQAAHDAANDGDGIYVYPSPNAYAATSVTKLVHITGGGWNLNPSTTGSYNTRAGHFVFYSGSEGSSLSGLDVESVAIYADSVTMKHCRMSDWSNLVIDANQVCIDQNQLFSILVSQNHSGVEISRNYIRGNGYGYYPGLNPASFVVMIEANCDVTLYNNIITNWYYNSSLDAHGVFIFGGGNQLLVNNSIRNFNERGSIYCYGASPVCINNVLTNDLGLNQVNCSYNVINSNADALFIAWQNDDYHLAPGSPAIGAGENGIDCGAYGGVSPFNDNLNTPSLPTVIQLTAPTTIVPADQPMPITIRARTND